MAIYCPTQGAVSWKSLLADPDKHWAIGYSARTLAHCWEDAKGLPPEIDALFGGTATLLLAIPEHKVNLPGGTRPSQTDLFALLRREDRTISCAIEGKVAEPFGPTVGEWLSSWSQGKADRLAYICDRLDLVHYLPSDLRYQLLHRSASSIIEAHRFKTDEAAMIVHSFSQSDAQFDDFAKFANYLGLEAAKNRLLTKVLRTGMLLHLAWVTGDAKFLSR